MLTIKLSKIGKTNKKVFRLIISEKSRDPYGNVLEILGSYNPYSKDLQVKGDRVKYWLSKGAQMTDTINNLLVGKNIIEGKKVKASKPGTKSEKRNAQLKAKADKKATPTPAPSEETKAEVKEAKGTEETKEEPKEQAKTE
ncbi:MAG: 30S ribosomal protein S16 [Candidatus Falkowbacteria bacterium]|nr:30S ribosomal protein S16 [Candidatus Falkowbacteria bacterium]